MPGRVQTIVFNLRDNRVKCELKATITLLTQSVIAAACYGYKYLSVYDTSERYTEYIISSVPREGYHNIADSDVYLSEYLQDA
ncbi:hypothetical protein J6590_054983 [Homalodisca vitripennis]|nr:hypothetical protein J6590_054983 [Homalodisca vitripennis]